MITEGPVGQGMLSLSIRDVSVLQASYMPFIQNGGIFMPTQRTHQLGEEIFLLLQLMDEAERIPIMGRVVWITPAHAENQRPQGVGIQFDEQVGKAINARILDYLAHADQQRPTLTL